MNYNITTSGFVPKKKQNIAEGEMSNYDSYVKKVDGGEIDQIVIFDSAKSLIDHVMHNMKAVGGNGTWERNEIGVYSKEGMNHRDIWAFGKDFPTFNQTIDALGIGGTKDKYLNMFEQKKHELYEKHPELYNLDQTAVVKKRRRRFSEEGDELDIDRYMTGDPAMWSSMPRQDSNKRCARFYIDVGASGGTDAKMISESIINSLALVDIVDKAGITTEVIMGRCNTGNGRKTRMYTVACVAKAADEQLDINRVLSFALTGFFRCLTFAARLNCNVDPGVYIGGGGWSFERSEDHFGFFNAVVKTRCADRYWTDSEMQIYIDQVKQFINSI